MSRLKQEEQLNFDDDSIYDSLDQEAETEDDFYGYDNSASEIEEEDAEEQKKKYSFKREKSTTTRGHYITNSVLLPEVIKAKEIGRITNELARMLMLITERYSCKSNFVGYSFREDMVSFALVNLMANALKFNPEKSNNPFAFYTTAIRNSFLQYLADERKHRDIRDQLIMDEGFNPSSTFLEGGNKEELE